MREKQNSLEFGKHKSFYLKHFKYFKFQAVQQQKMLSKTRIRRALPLSTRQLFSFWVFVIVIGSLTVFLLLFSILYPKFYPPQSTLRVFINSKIFLIIYFFQFPFNASRGLEKKLLEQRHLVFVPFGKDRTTITTKVKCLSFFILINHNLLIFCNKFMRLESLFAGGPANSAACHFRKTSSRHSQSFEPDFEVNSLF